MAFSRKRVYSLLFAIVISLFLVWLLLRQIENKSILLTLRNLSLPLAIAAFALYLVIYLSRVLRFNNLLRHPLPARKMFIIMCLHNVVNTALPARSGDLSYPYLLKRQGIPYAESLSGLLAARLFDLISIFVLFAAGLLFIGPLPAFAQRIEYGFLGMLLLVFLLLAVMMLWKLQIKQWVETVRRWSRTENISWMTKVQRLSGRIIDTLRTYATRRMIGRLLVHSVVQWFLMFSFSYVVLRALGMEVTMAQSFVGSALSMLVLVIPFQGILGFGTTEAVWVVMFLALGFPKEELITFAFASHIVSLAFTGIMGIYGVLTMRVLGEGRTKAKRA